jgi:hypothetical protein
MLLGNALVGIVKFFMIISNREAGRNFDPRTLVTAAALNKTNSIFRVLTQTIG